jgi:hypothetical protein
MDNMKNIPPIWVTARNCGQTTTMPAPLNRIVAMNGIRWFSPGCMKRLFADVGDALFDSKAFFPDEFQSSCHERYSLVFTRVIVASSAPHAVVQRGPLDE